MTDDPFHDWRSRPTATGIRRDPDIAPGVKAPERRVLVVPINLVKKKGKRGNIISYREFYPVALSLDIAMNAAEQARAAFNAIEYHEYQTARGTDRSVKHESHDSLLSFLEHAMVAVTFSFQALETFANEV